MIENYLHDLSVVLKERAKNAKLDKDSSAEGTELDYKLGYLMAYYEVTSKGI